MLKIENIKEEGPIPKAQLRDKIEAQEMYIKHLEKDVARWKKQCEMDQAVRNLEEKQKDTEALINDTLDAISKLTKSQDEVEGVKEIVYNLTGRDTEHVLVVTPTGIKAMLPTWPSN